jgi:double-stranded uracil-DNA glycosylase
MGSSSSSGSGPRVGASDKPRRDPIGAIDGSRPDPGHRVIQDWMGVAVETLEDLLRPGLRAVCIGINPAEVSVAAGHYYQGRAGQRLLSRLASVGALPGGLGWEDDRAYANGVGFTDIVKRPTRRAESLRAEEYEHGRPILAAKLHEIQPELVIFSFKEAATKYFSPFDGNGFVPRLQEGDTRVFVMPGPYERRENVDQRLLELGERLAME